MIRPLFALLGREWRGLTRQPADGAAGLVFALLVVALFPFALSPEPAELQRLAPGLVLIAVLLAQFISMEKLFSGDLASGALDVIALSPLPLPLYALTRALACWLGHGLPLLIASPLFLLLLHVDPAAMPSMMLAIFLASLILALLGTAGAALSLGSRQPGLLLPLILIPFAIPVLVFAAALAGGNGEAETLQSLFFLGALFFLYLALVPFIAAAALKGAIESA
jgi:heme exporter protein B